MEFGLGVLMLSPDAFWRMSLREFDRAAAGYRKSNGLDTDTGMTGDRLRELMAQYPDEPAS